MFKKAVNKVKEAISKLTKVTWQRWDMSTVQSREATVKDDYSFALTQREPRAIIWRQNDDYYNNKHHVSLEMYKQLKEQNIPWTPAVIPDSYIHVESQIIPDMPDFEFNGRDDDLDSQKAKQREYVVKFVLENNKINTMNTENERRLGILGDAFWKVSWDGNKQGYGFKGDIVIGNPGAENILPDPTAYTIDGGETFIYPYRMHRRKAAREFAKDFERIGKTIDEVGSDGRQSDTEIFRNQVRDLNDDTVQIVEYWFRQNEDGEETIDGTKFVWEAGDIACSIQINNTEIKYIPKYWIKTGKQNKLFPFVQYCKIPVYNNFWNKSDIEAIKDLQDQEDRELATAILNNTFMSNDIIVKEENSMVDGAEVSNAPGAIWNMKPGQINGVRRLGGLGSSSNRLEMINFLRSVIQETVGNFDSTQGKEPVRVTTASGIQQLNERADRRTNIKKADRLNGFELLYELIDLTALEFFDDNRLIFIGAGSDQIQKQQPQNMGQFNLDKANGPIIFKYNSDNMRVYDDATNEYYYPRVDATVRADDGIRKSKAFTLAATENLLAKPINETNYKLVNEMLDIMDTPNRKDIKEYYEDMFSAKIELAKIQTKQAIDAILNPPMPAMTNAQPNQDSSQTPPPNIEEIINSLSDEQLKQLQQNPDVLHEIFGTAGGENNG